MNWGDSGTIMVVLWGLLTFGYCYNMAVSWMTRKHYTEGFLSLVVAFGVLVTLIGAAFINWQAALLVLVCFAASGTPMMIGSIARYVRRREQEREHIKKEVIQ